MSRCETWGEFYSKEGALQTPLVTLLCIGDERGKPYPIPLLNLGCRVTPIQKLPGHTCLDTTLACAGAFDQKAMLEYFQALDSLEQHTDGALYELNRISSVDSISPFYLCYTYQAKCITWS